MAIVWALDRLRSLLLGIHVVVYTDCQALIHMNGLKTRNPQITRWLNLLQEFDIEIKHRPGNRMSHIDALSRAPVDSTCCETMDEMISDKLEVLITITEEEFATSMQHSDSRVAELINILKLSPNIRTKQQTERVQQYLLKDNLLYRRVGEGEETKYLWEVSTSMRKSIMVKYHDLSGHFGVDRTVAKIQEKYYFPRMERYVKYHINCCPECLLYKIPRGKRPGELHPILPGKIPFEEVNVDHTGPFVQSKRGNNHVLVIIDNLTKFVKIYAVKNTSTKAFLKCFNMFVLEFGLPKKIISNKGTCFTSKNFAEYCSSNGIQHALISIRHPQSNGQVER